MRQNDSKKIACLFPGIGYTCDKPLLYYSEKLLRALNWDTIEWKSDIKTDCDSLVYQIEEKIIMMNEKQELLILP